MSLKFLVVVRKRWNKYARPHGPGRISRFINITEFPSPHTLQEPKYGRKFISHSNLEQRLQNKALERYIFFLQKSAITILNWQFFQWETNH